MFYEKSDKNSRTDQYPMVPCHYCVLHILPQGNNFANYRPDGSLLILSVFLLLGIGFLTKSKFAWTLNFVWAALIVSGMIAATISGIFSNTDANGPLGRNEIIVLTVVASLTVLTTYSLFRTLKHDILNEMKVGRNQKKITLAITIILVCIWIFK